ncbi:MAG: ABC transporter ATP-binding protein, partial [Gammaproteobacteria bacterium]
MPVLDVRDLSIRLATDEGSFSPVTGLDFAVEAGEILGIVGESGCGKSVTLLALMGLLPAGSATSGSVVLEGRDLLDLGPGALRGIRGAEMAMVFQDPMSSLNPYLSVGRQVTEVLETHRGLGRDEARRLAGQLIEQVHVPDAAQCLDRYPHELSGGMRQRVMLAMALAGEPRV